MSLIFGEFSSIGRPMRSILVIFTMYRSYYTTMPSTKRVVLIEDMESYRKAFANALGFASDNFELIGAFGFGSSAIDFLKDNHCDVIVVDYQLSNTTGDKVIQAIREFDTEVIIIGVSFYEDVLVRKAMIESGADDFVSKMDDFNKIRRAILMA